MQVTYSIDKLSLFLIILTYLRIIFYKILLLLLLSYLIIIDFIIWRRGYKKCYEKNGTGHRGPAGYRQEK